MAKKSRASKPAPVDLASIPGIVKASDLPVPQRMAAEAAKRVVQLAGSTSRLAEYTMAPPEAAEFLGIGESTLRKRADAGEIHHIRVGSGQKRKYLFRRSDLERYLNAAVEVVGEPAPIPLDEIPPDDAQTNPAIEKVHAERPELFVDWTVEDWRELFSQHGDGGSLSDDGVVAAASEINRLRELRHKFESLIHSEHAKTIAVMIESLYVEQRIKPKRR